MESKLKSTLTELAEYSKFEPGWDGYSGSRFAPKVIEDSRALAENILQGLVARGAVILQFFPGPASDGSIDLEVWTHQENLVGLFQKYLNTNQWRCLLHES